MQNKSIEEKLNALITLVTLFVPRETSIPKLSEVLGVSTGTLHAHITVNFLKDVDYFQKKEGGKITIPLKTAMKIQKYYNNKRMIHG